jgi:hypothetical protein
MWQSVESGKISLAILDVAMPVGSGLDSRLDNRSLNN